MKQTIEAIIWDVGGVLIRDIPVSSAIQRKLDLPESIFRPIWDEQIDQYGSGLISEKQFWAPFEEAGSNPVDIDANVLGEPLARGLWKNEKVLGFVSLLYSDGFQQAVLSNTIPNHAQILREYGVFDMFAEDSIFLSNEIGFRKPDRRAYECVLKTLGLKPERTMFVDDNPAYVAGATALGMAGVHILDSVYEDKIIAAVSARL